MQLSTEQKLAIEYTDGPQIILAGPGSGKTLVIVEKAAYLVETVGLDPEQILVLTYSNNTADELNLRLQKREKEKSLPQAYTFHSFGQKIIEKRFEYLGYKEPPAVLSDYRKYMLLRQAYFETAEVPIGLSNPDSIIPLLRDFISRACDELVGPEKLQEFIKRKELDLVNITNEDQLADEKEQLDDIKFGTRFYEIYNQKKLEGNFIDFEDMLFGLYRIFKENSDVLKAERFRLKYILVDEFQDANSGQVATLALLGEKAEKICVVGDDDQSIYRFRGASYGSFVNFKRFFPEAITHALTVNYRGTPQIVAASQVLISHKTQDRFDPNKKLKSGKKSGSKIGAFISPDVNSEAQSVVSLIKSLLNRDIRPRDIAVISRVHDHRKQIYEALINSNIPVVEQRPFSIFSIHDVQIVSSLIRGAFLDEEADWIFPILFRYCGDLNPSQYSQIKESLDELSPFELLTKLESIVEMSSLSQSGLRFALDIINEIKEHMPDSSTSKLVEKALELSGLLSKAVVGGENTDRSAKALAQLWQVACDFEEDEQGDVHDFLDYLKWAEQVGAITLEQPNADGVNLLTAHSAKGLQFQVVIVVSLSERRFPKGDKKKRFVLPQELSKEIQPPPDAHTQEERRLMYVAMTRAANRLYLSGIQRIRVHISRFFSEVVSHENFDEYGEATKFGDIHDEPERIISQETDSDFTLKLPEVLNSVFSTGKNGHREKAGLENGLTLLTEKLWSVISSSGYSESPDDFKKMLIDLINKCELKEIEHAVIEKTKKPKLSYTDINTYNSCPLRYRFKYILKIPEKVGPHVHLGSAIHRTLHEVMSTVSKGEKLSLDNLKITFLEKWSVYRIGDKAWMESLKNAGLMMLENFAKRERRNLLNIVDLEKRFTLEYDNFILTGKIDRIDADENGEIYIVDYKAGRIGTPENAKAKADDQLFIYALACPSLYDKIPAEVAYYYLGDDSLAGFVVSEKDLQKVLEKISGIADKIAKEDFNSTPNSFECGRCSYKNICPDKVD
jgi:DNA helicase-2/ATP-dependent DNA helicase PcrA